MLSSSLTMASTKYQRVSSQSPYSQENSMLQPSSIISTQINAENGISPHIPATDRKQDPDINPSSLLFHNPNPKQTLQGKWSRIISSFALVAIPLLIVDLTIIAIIIFYREVEISDSIGNNQAFYLDYSISRFSRIVSLSSIISPFLTTFLMMLSSFPASAKIAEAIQMGSRTLLPTPFQLVAIIEMRMMGVFRPLKRLLSYWLIYKKKRVPFTPAMRLTTTTFILAINFGYVSSILFITFAVFPLLKSYSRFTNYILNFPASLCLPLIAGCTQSCRLSLLLHTLPVPVQI